MAFTNDPINNPIDRIRLEVGDIDEHDSLLTDSVYQYFIDISSSEKTAAIKAVDAIIALTSRLTDESTDEVSAKWSQLNEQYRKLKKDLVTKNSGSANGNGLVIMTGTKESPDATITYSPTSFRGAKQ